MFTIASLSPRETLRKRALHVFVLASIATAPILLVADAQFFIGRGASRAEVLGVALIVTLAAPAALALAGLLVSAATARVGWMLHLVLIGALASLIISESLYPLGLTIELQALLVLVVGVAAAIAYARIEGARSLVSALVPLPVIVLAFIFLATPVSALVFSGEEEVDTPAQPDAEAPVVMVVFDELPGTALMDAKRRLDERRYPNFAALGEDATWYRNATTTRSDTELAVPTLATGISAPGDSLPTTSDHPRSLFTLLGESHEMHVSEPWTNICPDRLCDGGTESTDEGGLGSLLATVPRILGYVAVPDAGRLGVPSPRESGAINRPGQVATFIEEIEPADGPVLHFLHVLLPHQAFRYLPSGERYPDLVGRGGELGGQEAWPDDEWLPLQHEQRFLLQLRYTDRLLGELLDQLRATDLYERSMIVVTADHGVSFRADDERRDATGTNAPDILSVPLLVKMPGKGDGGIDDRAAITADVLPTIADAIGADLPWEVDGESLLGEEVTDRPVEIANLSGADPVELTPEEYIRARDEALERRLDSLGDGETSLFAIGPSPDLRGEEVEPLLGDEADAEATIIDGVAARDYDPDADFLPARIAGDIDGVDTGEPLAVALNGRVAATTYGYDGVHGVEFAAMIPPSLIEEGDNELEVFAIEDEGGEIVLRPVDVSY